MDIKNMPEFVRFCQDNTDRPGFPADVATVTLWADIADANARVWSGQPQPRERFIDEARNKLIERGYDIGTRMVLLANEVLPNHWVNGEAYSRWFSTRVIIDQVPTPETR